MSDKFKKGVLIFILVLFGGWFLYTAISDLTNKTDLHTVHLAGATEILEVEHIINGFIPAGKEHYYVGIDGDSGDAYIIHASKGWYNKHFDSNKMAVDSDGIAVTALSKPVDNDIAGELSSRTEQIEGVTYPLGTRYSLELSYKRNAILKLVILVLTAVLIAIGIKIAEDPLKVKSSMRNIYVLAVCIVMVLIIVVIR